MIYPRKSSRAYRMHRSYVFGLLTKRKTTAIRSLLASHGIARKENRRVMARREEKREQ